MTVRQQVPASERITRVEFAVTDPSYPFVAVSSETGGRALMEELIPRMDGEFAQFFTVLDTEPGDVLSLAAAHGSMEAELLEEYDDGGLFEFVVRDNCPVVHLADAGALPRDVESVDGKGFITTEIPTGTDPEAVIDDFLGAHDDAELVAKRQQPYTTPLFSHREFQHAVEDQLTERQQEVLSAAHSAGYYEWPRERTAEELAVELDISPATLHEHLRTAEQKLISSFFEAPTA